MYRSHMPTNVRQVVYRSNRQRLRDADAAVIQHQRDRTILLAVLAQSGGEVVVTSGTIAQLQPDMSFAVVNGATANEKIIRLVPGSKETNAE